MGCLPPRAAVTTVNLEFVLALILNGGVQRWLMRILIAEDDQVLADDLQRTLRSSGAVVSHVASGTEDRCC